jgi:ubiquinone/menaquinone biosynthesis C-methylase UbiE
MIKNIFKLKSQYFTLEVKSSQYQLEVEKDWIGRPAWIKILNSQNSLPRFLSIETSQYGEVIYKAFGNYYFPLDYTNAEECRFMDGVAKDYDLMVADKFNIPMAKALIEKVGIKSIPHNIQILDLGCGTGIISQMLSDYGFSNFTLVDFSSEMLQLAKIKLNNMKNVEYECIDIKALSIKRNYDLVLSVMLFNSFNEKDTVKVLSNIIKHLNPGAIIAILEDKEKKAYSKYFKTKYSGMVDTGLRKKYIFIGTVY